jgi:hypothetical protein
MAEHDQTWDAAFAAEQHRLAADARHRADAMRDDLDRRMRSAEHHQAETNALLRRGIHRDLAR